jgi:hypothetical protein
MDRRETGTTKRWTRFAIGMATVVALAIAGLALVGLPKPTPPPSPAALPAAVVELPPRPGAVPDPIASTNARPARSSAVSLAPKAVADACDDEAARAAGAKTLMTKKKMREIRNSETYRAAYGSCLKAKGFTT